MIFQNPFSLEGKSILVTGASSGIGRAIAIAISNMGASLIITGRNEDRLTETLSYLASGKHSFIAADMTTELPKIIESLPLLDGFVNAAGLIEIQPFQLISEEQINRLFEINFFAPFLLTKQLIKNKLIVKNSSIVFISSLAGNIVASKGNTAYSASKSALSAMAKTLALELAAKSIRVNSILPGMVKTEMMKSFLLSLTSEQIEVDESKYPLGYGTPEDVANAAIYLLSGASKWMTGSSLIIDGGFSIQ